MFAPHSYVCDSTQVKNLLHKCIELDLVEYGINLIDVISGTCDSESDLKRLFDVCMDSKNEWCISHMCN